MKQAIEVLNGLEAEGAFLRYAIGGAIAALFYVEPFETEDLDVLILVRPEVARSLMPLAGIYDRLRSMGFQEDGPYMLIHGIPVQFLLVYNPLVDEAVRQARDVAYQDVMTRVPTPEHLCAIMLNTGRAKDRLRFELMREQVNLDEGRLREILDRHGLMERYRQWTAE